MRSVFGNRGTEVQFDTGKAEDASRFLTRQRPVEPRYGVGLSTPVLTVCVLVCDCVPAIGW